MSFNLLRNARVFFTTNVNSQGVVNLTGATNSNTYEIQVLEGFSFSQNTSQETVGLNEAGALPVRGQRSFNTALEPVDWSMSTYIRPQDNGGNNTAEENKLWNAMFATDPIGGANPAWSDGVASNATVVLDNSQTHQLQAFGLIIVIDNASFIIDNCALDSASIDFGLDSIATIAWAGKGTGIRQVGLAADSASPVNITGGVSEVQQLDASGATAGTFTISWDGAGPTASIAYNAAPAAIQTALEGLSNLNPGDVTVTGSGTADANTTTITFHGRFGDVAEITVNSAGLTGGTHTPSTITPGTSMGTALAKVTTAPYIANKLSTLAVAKEIGGTGKAYTLALTGGSVQFANNLTYLTPANLGVVNQPTTYFTGTRAISGSLNAYLRTGSANTEGLLADMLAGSTSEVDPAFDVEVSIGGKTNAVRVEIDMPATVFTIPTVATDQVISTTINFTGQGSNGAAFDIGASNEVSLRYFA